MTDFTLGANVRPVTGGTSGGTQDVNILSPLPIPVEVVSGAQSQVTAKPYKISSYSQEDTTIGGADGWLSDGNTGSYQIFESPLLDPSGGFEFTNHFQTLILNIQAYNDTGAEINGYTVSNQLFIRAYNTITGATVYTPISDIVSHSFNQLADQDANISVTMYSNNDASDVPNSIDMNAQSGLAPFTSPEFPIVNNNNFKQSTEAHNGILGFSEYTNALGQLITASTVIYLGYIPANQGANFPVLSIYGTSSSSI